MNQASASFRFCSAMASYCARMSLRSLVRSTPGAASISTLTWPGPPARKLWSSWGQGVRERGTGAHCDFPGLLPPHTYTKMKRCILQLPWYKDKHIQTFFLKPRIHVFLLHGPLNSPGVPRPVPAMPKGCFLGIRGLYQKGSPGGSGTPGDFNYSCEREGCRWYLRLPTVCTMVIHFQ